MTEVEWLACEEPARMLRHLELWNAGTGEAEVRSHPLWYDKRKLRLFACARCRLMWDGLDYTKRKIVEQAERYADGKTKEFYRHARERRFEARSPQAGDLVHDDAWLLTIQTEFDVRYIAGDIRQTYKYQPPETQAALLRDIFGNPYHPSLSGNGDDGWFYGPKISTNTNSQWKRLFPLTESVLAIATAIYDERQWDRCPILADALEESGCQEVSLLEHLRGREPDVCSRCDGDGKAHGSDRPFEWSPDPNYLKCVVCKGSGFNGEWRPLRGPHVRGCFAIDLILGKS